MRLRTVTLARNDVEGDWYIIVGKGFMSFRLFRGCCNKKGRFVNRYGGVLPNKRTSGGLLFDTLKNKYWVCAFAPWIAPTNRVTNNSWLFVLLKHNNWVYACVLALLKDNNRGYTCVLALLKNDFGRRPVCHGRYNKTDGDCLINFVRYPFHRYAVPLPLIYKWRF